MVNNYFPTDYQEFIHLSRYARWLGDRREAWPETVERYFEFMSHHLMEKYGHKIPNREELEEAVLSLQVMPSMRALMTAGLALERWLQLFIHSCRLAPCI